MTGLSDRVIISSGGALGGGGKRLQQQRSGGETGRLRTSHHAVEKRED